MDLFEKATRDKVRFETSVGLLSVEDLWDLPLVSSRKVNLDSVAISVNKELKECETESFVQQSNPLTNVLQLKLDILKHIISVKLQEAKDRENKAARESRRQELLALKAKKRQELDGEKTMEEIDRELAELTQD